MDDRTYSLSAARAEAAGGLESRRSSRTFSKHPQPETAHDPDDDLCSRAAGFRAHQLAGHGYRQPAPANMRSSGKRPQRSPGDAVTEVAGGAADLLEALSP